MPRVIIVHGWDGYPEEGWFPWLKRELEKKGFEVQVPAMPNPAKPKIETWVPHLAKIVGEPNENLFLVGHSIGCQTILRYLESLHADKKIGGAVLVAGFFKLILGTNEEEETAKPWLETPIDFGKVKSHSNNFTAVFSDNDPSVSLENKKLFEENLGAKTIVLSNKGHFSGGMDKCFELPIALESVLELTQYGKQ